MVALPHMIVGAALGAYSPNVLIAFGLGFFSHYLLYLLPHWDYIDDIKDFNFRGSKKENLRHLKKISLDFIIGVALVVLLSWSQPQRALIFIGAIAAILPDVLEAFYENFDLKFLNRPSRIHSRVHGKIHHSKNLSFWRGLPIVFIIFLIAVLSLVL